MSIEGNLVLSNAHVIAYRVAEQLPGIWCAYELDDTRGKGGWGGTQQEAVEDLRCLIEDQIQ